MKTRKYTIGIVEDDEFAGTMLAWRLNQHAEYKVSWFCSGEELLKEKNFDPDLLILDYNLDGRNAKAMNGGQLASQLKKTPIVFMSGQEDLSTAVDLLHSGAYDYVIKDHDAFERVEKSVADVIDTIRTNESVKKLDNLKKKDFRRIAFLISTILFLVAGSFLL
ncbi:MAG: response regulator [Chitinophagales bacterium]|nr:response regulator [Chitinophagales bacterium]